MFEYIALYVLIGLAVMTSLMLRVKYEVLSGHCEDANLTWKTGLLCVLVWPRTIYSMVVALRELKEHIAAQDAAIAALDDELDSALCKTISIEDTLELLDRFDAEQDELSMAALDLLANDREITLEEFAIDLYADFVKDAYPVAMKHNTRFYYRNNPPDYQMNGKYHSKKLNKTVLVLAVKSRVFNRYLIQVESEEACQNCCEYNISPPYWTSWIKLNDEKMIWLEGQMMNTYVYTVQFVDGDTPFEASPVWFEMGEFELVEEVL